jgi:ureidoglycolate lyase
MRPIKPEKLTCLAFEPFGTVIEVNDVAQAAIINAGTCLKFANLALPDCSQDGGCTAIHIYRATPLPLPITLAGFERHSQGTQAFFPLSGRPYLVAVAPPGSFEVTKVRLFKAEGNQGVQYDSGTWHHFCLALGADSEFLVIDRLSATPDCDDVFLPIEQQFRIEL